MREIFEFRIAERVAAEYLPAGCGRVLDGWLRVIEVERQTPLFNAIGHLDFRFKAGGKPKFDLRIERVRRQAITRLGSGSSAAVQNRLVARCSDSLNSNLEPIAAGTGEDAHP
jgi:hypothetical protein